MYRSIHTLFYEVRVRVEIVGFAMFEDEETLRGEKLRGLKYHVWQFRQFGQRIGRIGKNKVEGACSLGQIAQYVGAEHDAVAVAHHAEKFLDE